MNVLPGDLVCSYAGRMTSLIVSLAARTETETERDMVRDMTPCIYSDGAVLCVRVLGKSVKSQDELTGSWDVLSWDFK